VDGLFGEAPVGLAAPAFAPFVGLNVGGANTGSPT
jgi:hypothetical protein